MTSFLGILSLDTQFPRIVGDAGNPGSYSFPAHVRVISGADARVIVSDGLPAQPLLDRFIEAAKALEAEGAFGLVSTCGFLVTAQDAIAAEVDIPVALSGLVMLPLLHRSFGTGKIGVLTASQSALGPNCLAATGADPKRTVIGGLEHVEAFANCFLASKDRQSREFDAETMGVAIARRAADLIEADPDIRAILLECGNLPPYAGLIRKATGRPVYSVLDLAVGFHRALHMA